jgi:DNA (cytosine-5)-methyltransferase 1
VLSAEEFGTPQVRKRVFIVASRVGDPAELLPAPTHRSAAKFKTKKVIAGPKKLVTDSAAIEDLPPLTNGGGVQKIARTGSPFGGFQREARRGTRTLYNHVCRALTDVNLTRIAHVPEGGNWRDVPFELLPAGMRRARSSDHTKRYGRLARRGLASTLLTKCDPHWGACIHPTQDRTISVREAARLQGFPDRFRFAGNAISKHYEQVGNAVPVTVARALGLAAVAHIREPAAESEIVDHPSATTELGRAA